MSIGLFTDKTHQPTKAEVREAVGPRFPLWQALLEFVEGNYTAEEDFKFLYGKSYGWAMRFRSKGKLLISLYPTHGGFTAQVNLSPEAIEAAGRMKLGTNVRQAIAKATPYPEGRWLFIPVGSKSDIDDIRAVLSLRQPPKNKGK